MARPNQANVVNLVATVIILLSLIPVYVSQRRPGPTTKISVPTGTNFYKADCGPDSARPGSLVQELAETLSTLSHGWCED
jgi:hypothetical protein